MAIAHRPVRLTLWYVAAMMLVLGVYISIVFIFVSRNAAQTLDQQLRRDFQWAAATVDVGPDGQVIWPAEPLLVTGDEELPWVQVWTGDGRLRLFQSNEAQRRHVPDSTSLVADPSPGFPGHTRRSEDDRGVIGSFPIEGESSADADPGASLVDPRPVVHSAGRSIRSRGCRRASAPLRS